MKSAIVYVLAAFAEIAGCFSFWAWLRLDKSIYWLIPGMVALGAFAYFLTLIDSAAAGRAYAAYGGVYIVASLFWLWAVEFEINNSGATETRYGRTGWVMIAFNYLTRTHPPRVDIHQAGTARRRSSS